MKNVEDWVQKEIDKTCKTIEDVKDVLTNDVGNCVENRGYYFKVSFNGKNYKALIVDSGRGDDPGNTYAEVDEFIEIK